MASGVHHVRHDGTWNQGMGSRFTRTLPLVKGGSGRVPQHTSRRGYGESSRQPSNTRGHPGGRQHSGLKDTNTGAGDV